MSKRITFTNATEIKSAVDAGQPVKWANDGYEVIKDSRDQYLIVCSSNQSAIGLTWSDGETLNGRPEDFYAVVEDDTEYDISDIADAFADQVAGNDDSHVEYADIHVEAVEGGGYTGRYAVYDRSGGTDNPLDDDEYVTFTRFANGAERDAWLAENVKGIRKANTPQDVSNLLGERRFLVERYEHSLVRYSTVDAHAPYPDRRWDVAVGVAVIELSDEFSATTRDEYRELADSLLERFSDWCNGDTYAVAEVQFTVSTNGDGDLWIDADEAEYVHGYIGADEAKEVVRSGF